jgi:hypothetical protein
MSTFFGVAEPRDEFISGSRLKLIGDLQHHPANQQRSDFSGGGISEWFYLQ